MRQLTPPPAMQHMSCPILTLLIMFSETEILYTAGRRGGGENKLASQAILNDWIYIRCYVKLIKFTS